MMADRRDNSALIALSELRQIEEDRIKQEEQEETLRLQASERRRAEDEARRRADEEARRRAEEDARKAEEEKHRKEALEGQLRLQESERRARIEAEAHLAAKRIEAEVHANAVAKKAPLGLIFGIVGVLVVVAGGLGTYLYMSKVDAEKKAQRAELARTQLEADMKAADERFESESAKIKREFDEKLSLAKTDADRERLRQQMNEAAAAAKANRARARDKAKDAAAKTGGRNLLKGLSDTDDPLGNLKRR
jgi:membrane protein involved in colicin uptake